MFLDFQTHRDSFAIDIDRDALLQRIKDMHDTSLSDDQFKEKYNLNDNDSRKLISSRHKLRNDKEWKSHINILHIQTIR